MEEVGQFGSDVNGFHIGVDEGIENALRTGHVNVGLVVRAGSADLDVKTNVHVVVAGHGEASGAHEVCTTFHRDVEVFGVDGEFAVLNLAAILELGLVNVEPDNFLAVVHRVVEEDRGFGEGVFTLIKCPSWGEIGLVHMKDGRQGDFHFLQFFQIKLQSSVALEPFKTEADLKRSEGHRVNGFDVRRDVTDAEIHALGTFCLTREDFVGGHRDG